MKVNKLLFCLLFLMLGTTTAWADKYYQPGSYKGNSTPRLTLEQAVGKKFMIYNTAINGGEDRTGFLRNGGVSFEHDKSKERDLFIYNESFVYTMEAYDDNADGVNDWYAIKSVNTGLYVNINGKTDILKATDAKLYITSWDKATEGKSDVNMESWKYNVIAKSQITSGGHGSTVFVVKNGNTYWNGKVNAFDKWTDGHPFAFYIAHEVTNGDYLQDLHMYSRADIFSAQQTYGYVQYASQISSNKAYTDEGDFGDLIDGEATTYNVTDRTTYNEGDNHYYQINLGKETNALYLYMQRRADGKNAPTKYELQVCATADGEFVTVGGERETTLADNNIYSSDKIELGDSYQYIRIVAKETTTSGFKCMGFSELYVLPAIQEVEDAIKFVAMANKDPLYTRATQRVYKELVEKYNSTCPEARLLSGVPMPGNKYRIYADTYDRENSRYVNREIMAGSEGLLIKEPGTYNASDADGKKQHEWYCEQTNDGKLVFRNVADPTKYLADGRVVTEPYKWSINTVETHHYGVPLKNYAMQYLAVANNGGYWQGDVKDAQDQTLPYTYTVPGNTEDENPDNNEPTTQVKEMGVCTDFLFIPVPLSGKEKKITITGNDLVKRNTKLRFDANNDGEKEVLPLPYARMFVSEEKFSTLELQLLCNDIHTFMGVKVNDEEQLNTEIATCDGNVVTFDFTKVNSGDVLNIQLKIKKPFEVMNGDEDVTEETHLYLIRNKRQFGLPQQARPNRASIDVEYGDGPISSQTGKMYYAKFNQRDANMLLLEGTPEITELNVEHLTSGLVEGLDASSLFYFTKTEDMTTDQYYSVNIQNVTTAMKCADQAMWNTNGNTWFVQPKRTDSYSGYNIGRTKLGATNNPNDAWCSNHDDGNRIVVYNANDDGAAWEFVPVSDDAAKELLKAFIDKVADELYDTLDAKKEMAGIDKEKVEYYRFVAKEMKERAAVYYKGQTINDNGENAISKLLQFAQNLHMLEHEVEYALYELPDLSKDIVKVLSTLKDNSEQPHWYYIRNVKGTADAGKDSYAAFTADEEAMALQQYAANEGKKLANLFYFVGEKNSYASVANPDYSGTDKYTDYPGNNLIIDEYLKAHIHNFMAKEVTLVSRNVLLTENTNIKPGYGQQDVVTGLNLKGNENWSVELEYDLAGNTSFNAYGSCLLASTGDPLGDSYVGGFQVYLKDDRSIVIKCNNADDGYRFWHTQDYFSHIKVVITYSQNNVTLDVYNSLGEKKTMTVNSVTLNDITKMTSALPAEGAVITRLATYQVEAMTWKAHEDVQAMVNKDEWFILPSSNTNYPGLAIVLGEPCDTRMGWTNDHGKNTFVGNDLGIEDNSTWVFERVTDFDAHVKELLEMYNYEDCVIYDKDIARLYALIKEKSTFIMAKPNGDGEEAAFNELYYAFLNYKGRTAAELQAPKPGSLYTIRPMVEENTANALVVHVDKSNGTYSTKEVYNGGVVRAGEDEKSYDPRGVWVFEGTAGADGFLALENLKLKNLHTQCYLTALGADASAVNEVDAAQVTLGTIGGCITKFQVGDKQFMNRTAVTPTLAYDRAPAFWGDEVGTYPDGVKDQITLARLGDGTVRCKRLDVEVKTEGEESSKNVVVTFTYDEGNHKINILGVELLGNNGEMLYADYHYGRAGGEHVGNTYTIEGVVAGAYTMNCYVFEPNNGDQLTEHKGHFTIDGVVAYSGEGKIINDGTATTKWIVEEILDPEESVYYETNTSQHGHGTLKLGFPALIPQGVEAFHARVHGDIRDDRYISMVSYGEPEDANRILPSNTAVMLRNVNGDAAVKQFKFYYSKTDAASIADNYIHGSLYYTVIKCSSYDTTDFDGDGNGDGDVNIYMLQASKNDAKLYWIYEEYSSNGEIKDEDANTDNGGYVICKANRAFMVLPKIQVAETTSFSLRFESGETTDIEDTMDENVNVELVESIYDLQGRKLDEISEPGIYIINGKKVFIK